jgi:hypothetical protein
MIRLAASMPKGSSERKALLEVLLASERFPAVLADIEDDFKRGALTRRERAELREAVSNASSEQEAWRVVDQHRKGRTASVDIKQIQRKMEQVAAKLQKKYPAAEGAGSLGLHSPTAYGIYVQQQYDGLLIAVGNMFGQPPSGHRETPDQFNENLRQKRKAREAAQAVIEAELRKLGVQFEDQSTGRGSHPIAIKVPAEQFW